MSAADADAGDLSLGAYLLAVTLALAVLSLYVTVRAATWPLRAVARRLRRWGA